MKRSIQALSALAIGLGTLILQPGAAAALPRASVETEATLQEPKILHNALYCMTLALYFEGGSTGESEEGLRQIGYVIKARAKDNRRIWGGNDICEVVFYKRKGVCQFSFACVASTRYYNRGPAWERTERIAREVLEGNETPDGEAKFARYYLNPEVTPDRNICRFKREFAFVIKAGRHFFFRHLMRGESLLESKPVECVRAELKAARVKLKQKLAALSKKLRKKKARTRLARTANR